MKKLISAVIVLTMLLSLAACAKPVKKDPNPEESPSASPVASPENPKESTDPKASPEATVPQKSEDPTVTPTASPTPPAANPTPPAKPTTPVKPSPTPVPPTPAPVLLSLADVLSSIQYGVDLPKVGNISVTAENFKNYLFIDYIDGCEALASEALVGSIAHSLVVLKLPDGSDPATVAASVSANADARKWICVEAEKVTVSHASNASGKFVMLVMSDTATADAIAANFAYLMSIQPAK